MIDAFRVGRLRRQAKESVTVWRILVHENDHSTTADFFQSFFDNRYRHASIDVKNPLEKSLLALRQKTLNVLANQVGFEVDFITNPADAQISVL